MAAAPKRKRNRWEDLFHRLVAETHAAHSATGREQPAEVSRQQVLEALEEVWPDYLRHEVAKACGLGEEPAKPEGE